MPLHSFSCVLASVAIVLLFPSCTSFRHDIQGMKEALQDDGQEVQASGDQVSKPKDPGAGCSATSWCSGITSSSPFCAKRRGGEKLCYIAAGHDAGATPQFCTVPGHVVGGKCALKTFDETCEEDSDCAGHTKCSATEKKCKYSCQGLAGEYCPKCTNGHNKAPVGMSVLVGEKLDGTKCPECCSSNGHANLCCKAWRTQGAMKVRRANGCSKIKDEKCIDQECEDVGTYAPDFRCTGSGNNIGQL